MPTTRSGPSTSWRAARCRPVSRPIEIDGEHYWDGGLVSNTPLQYVLDYVPRRSRLIFQVDLFPARGPLPTTSIEVGERDKDIRYSSRTRAATECCASVHDVRHNINALLGQAAGGAAGHAGGAVPATLRLRHHHGHRRVDLPAAGAAGPGQGLRVQPPHHGSRWARGRADAEAALRASPWLAPMPPELGARTFDLRAPRAAALEQGGVHAPRDAA